MNNLLFQLGFSTLIAHELDAMTQSEWRLLFILRNLPESVASTTFVVAHIPLMAGLLWLTNDDNLTLRQGARVAIATFLVIHGGLHKRLDHHPLYTFDSPLSLWLIYGGSGLGLLYLVIVSINWLSRNRGQSLA